MTATPGLRQRLAKGAGAQAFGQIVRVLVQVGGVSILAGKWGLDLYGEWLILAALPTYLSFSDIGFFSAASNEMIMAVGRNDRKQALLVFQAVSRAVGLLLLAFAVALPLIAAAMPLTTWLNLSTINEATAGWVVVMLGLDTLLIAFGSLFYGGFACEGRYGEGLAVLALITLAEFCALAAVVLGGGGPGLGASAMLGARFLGTIVMYFEMRRRAPWLRFGLPPGYRQVLRRLLAPALASGAFPAGLAINVQAMVILVGVSLSPASAAVFSTLRTMSRVVIQLLQSVFAVVAPEFSKAFAERDADLLRTIHRRACQTAVWLAAPVIAVLAVVGDPLVEIWTSGAVQPAGALIYLFLAVAAVDSLWYTSLAVLFATNRHGRVATYYVAASAAVLPVAYLLLQVWGLDGAAVALLLAETFMLVVVLRQALPAAHDTLRDWLASLIKPPRFLLPGRVRTETRG